VGVVSRTQRRRERIDREAGELLAVEAIDRSGLVITSDGAFVRALEVIPPNPLLLSVEERQRMAACYAQVLARLRPGQAVQVVIEARPVNLEEILAETRLQVEAFAGAVPTPESATVDPLALSRWRLYAGMQESLQRNSAEQTAVDMRAWVICPYWPGQRSARALLHPRAMLTSMRIGRRLPRAPLERDSEAHSRAVRESLTHTDTIRAELEALNLPVRMVNGEEYVQRLWGRFNPTAADKGAAPPTVGAEVLGDLDGARDRREAQLAARRLRELVGQSLVDFKRSHHYAEVDRDVEQTIYAASIADSTFFGWLLHPMLTRQPFVISVFCHALDRRQERQRLKWNFRRIFGINRAAEAHGRVPDFDRYAQEEEQQRLLAEMAGHERANLFRVSIYQAVRARGPEPNLATLSEAVDYCTDQIQATGDCSVDRGATKQEPLWLSTLPLGRDVFAQGRKYVTRNAADCLPLVGTSCGSPRGIPFGFADPSRTLERLDPYDRTHANQVGVVSGHSGAGKTMLCNVILARCLALGARAFAIDRAGHYGVLTDLIEGAQQIELGDDGSEFALNPWDVPDPANVSREKVGFLSSLHAVMMGEEGLDTLERAQLGAAIRGVYAYCAACGDVPRESLLRDKLAERAEEEQAKEAPELAAALRNLAERLGEFCGDGAYAYLLDKETTVPRDAPLVVFDTRRVPDAVLTPVMFAVLEFVVRQVEGHSAAHRERMADPTAPMFLGKCICLIDEAWKLLEKPSTGAYANDLARRARHLGLFLLVSSQQLSDFSTEHGIALLRNSTMQMLLAQHPDEVPFIRDALHLSDEEASLIARLKTVKPAESGGASPRELSGAYSEVFFVNGTRGRGKIALRIGPTEYWAFTSDPLHDVPLRERKIREHDGNVWAAIAELARVAEPARPGDRSALAGVEAE
jgi:hypothetical protein